MTVCLLVGVCRFSGSVARHSVHISKQRCTSAHVLQTESYNHNKYYLLVVTFSLGHFLSLCDPVSSSSLSSSHVPEDGAARGDTHSDSNQQQNTQRFQLLIPNFMTALKTSTVFSPFTHIPVFLPELSSTTCDGIFLTQKNKRKNKLTIYTSIFVAFLWRDRVSDVCSDGTVFTL